MLIEAFRIARNLNLNSAGKWPSRNRIEHHCPKQSEVERDRKPWKTTRLEQIKLNELPKSRLPCSHWCCCTSGSHCWKCV